MMSGEENDSNRTEASDSEYSDLIDENIIKILFTTDINLGYEQTVDREQEDDSFRTFEEILEYARDYEADAILLGGNLFYEANPPLNVITKCISLLRKYCLSDKPVKIDCLTDPGWIFNHCSHKVVNFKDPNLNIGMPIFSIHGHRDAPQFSPVGSLDLLAATGLINYFGKWADNDEISIPPLLIRKGSTTLSLYGLSHMNDQKLSKLMKRNKFELLQEEAIANICNVMILHQKRARPDEAGKTCVSESLLPDFLNLVIWAHEPVCRIQHEPFANKTFRISQPGSCIATSLTRGETATKHVALLQIYKDAFKMKYIRLKTVRPLVFDRIKLNDFNSDISKLLEHQIGSFGLSILRSRKEAIERFLDNYIEKKLLPSAQTQETGHPKQPKKPLIRLKIDYDDNEDCIDLFRLAKKYQDKIANPSDIIKFCNYSLENDVLHEDGDDEEELSAIFFQNKTENWTRTVEGGISEYFSRDENRKKLRVLSITNLNTALKRFKNHDKKAFDRAVRDEIQETVDFLMNVNVEVDNALELLQEEESNES